VQPHRQPPTTIAVLGADTVVGSAIRALLEGHGYRITPLDSHPTGVADELLEGADLLLLAPRLEEGTRGAFVGAIGKRTPEHAHMPVIALSPASEKVSFEGVVSVPWPCDTKALVERIEVVLADAPPYPTGGSGRSRLKDAGRGGFAGGRGR
jgi:hypothetical protein